MAYDWYVDAKVVTVEADYIPNSIAFMIDTTGGSCPGGTFLNYFPTGANATDKASNISAQLSLLLSALAAGKTVRVFGSNTGSVATNIWILR